MKALPLVLLALASCASAPPPELSPAEQELLRPYPADDAGNKALVDAGDRLFLDAISAVRDGDRAAGERLYQKARSSYLEAQMNSRNPIPPPLIRRINECVQRIAALQRTRRS